MRKKKSLTTYVAIGCVLVCLLVIAGKVWTWAESRGLHISEVTCIVSEKGVVLYDSKSGPTTMAAENRFVEKVFEDLETGDRLRIVQDYVRESFPSQTCVFYAKKIGEAWEVSEQTIKALEDLGWKISYP